MRTYELDLKRDHFEICPGTLRMGGKNPQGDRIGFTNRFMEWNGRPYFLLSGEFHFSRYPYLFWEREILKMKAAGLRTIATYIFWIHHEEEEGTFDWSGDRNLRCFIELCGKHGLTVFLRVGPFCNGECRNGGLPDWIFGYPFVERSNEPKYLFYVERLYREIGRQAEGLMFKDGGPVVGIQLENEYDCVSRIWGVTSGQDNVSTFRGESHNEGIKHMLLLKEIAIKAGLDVPLYCCTSWGGSPAPIDEILPVSGAYSEWPWTINDKNKVHCRTNEYLFIDNQKKSGDNHHCNDVECYPHAEFELGGGAQHTYPYRFLLSPESVEAMALVKVGSGTNMINYYIFHGCSNPIGKQSFMNIDFDYPKISYDFQAPFSEFGQTRESCRRLKLLHYFLAQFEDRLAPTEVVLPLTNSDIVSGDADTLRFSARASGGSGFLFLNNYQDHFEMRDQKDISIDIGLTDEKLRIPEAGGFELKRNGCIILPFNFEMNGLRLKYSLAQLITSLDDGDGSCWFFYSDDGIETEYCFDARNITDLSVIKGEILRSDGYIRIRQQPGIDNLIILTKADGTRERIITLSRTEALKLWKVKLWGKDRVVISNSDVSTYGSILKLYGCENRISLRIFPFDGRTLDSSAGIYSGQKENIFSRFDIQIAKKEIIPRIIFYKDNKAEIGLQQDTFDDMEEVFLKIDYTGDVARAFIGGRLKADDFYHGEPWVIGLKRFERELSGKSLYIFISPQRKGETVVRNEAVGLKQEFIGEKIAEIHSIEAYPEYSIMLRKTTM
jgi:Beta-galactosidase